jgi:hypothetical protein
MKVLALILFLLFTVSVYSQYAPAAGIPGSSAIHADSSVFVNWGQNAQFVNGWLNIADKSLGKIGSANETDVYGKANNSTYSLGDSGYVTYYFSKPLINGPSWDFAVFENSFDGNFLELARVQISSNGIAFYEFPAHSLTQTQSQKASFDTLSAHLINNLAGKYRGMFGTPFDLEEMKNIAGLDINNITHIRIVDVVGSIDSNFASIDTAGNFINDPYPTPFAAGGFDLDAIGIIHQFVGFDNDDLQKVFKIYPNPAKSVLKIECNSEINIKIFSIDGREIIRRKLPQGLSSINISELERGIYFLQTTTNYGDKAIEKFVKE